MRSLELRVHSQYTQLFTGVKLGCVRVRSGEDRSSAWIRLPGAEIVRRSRADGAVTLVRSLHAISGARGKAFIGSIRMGLVAWSGGCAYVVERIWSH